ncbi:MAG TPA: peptidylprolyl isomerase [Aquifex aeolicus]|nr:peptidylprolyl isomerase [Aquifex aeolicus]
MVSERVKKLWLSLWLSIPLLCSPLFPELLDRVVANVNGEPVLESELSLASLFYGEKDRSKLLNILIDKRLIAQFLRERGLSIPADYIERLVDNLARSSKKSVEELYRDLYSEGITPGDLRSFLEMEVSSTLGLEEYLRNRVSVSEIEIELELLKRGEVEFIKEVELLVVEKDRKDELLRLVGEIGGKLGDVAKGMGLKLERLRVKRGELVEAVDKEVWRAKEGELVVGEDDENIYMVRVVKTVRVFSGKSEDEIREEIIKKKMEIEKRELVQELREKSFVEILL